MNYWRYCSILYYFQIQCLFILNCSSFFALAPPSINPCQGPDIHIWHFGIYLLLCSTFTVWQPKPSLRNVQSFRRDLATLLYHKQRATEKVSYTVLIWLIDWSVQQRARSFSQSCESFIIWPSRYDSVYSQVGRGVACLLAILSPIKFM